MAMAEVASSTRRQHRAIICRLPRAAWARDSPRRRTRSGTQPKAI